MPTRPKTFRNKQHVEVRVQQERERVRGKNEIYNYAWRKLRNRFIHENPLCVECLKVGITEAATDIDHIIPLTGVNDPTRLDPSALQALCHVCHSKKTRGEM